MRRLLLAALPFLLAPAPAPADAVPPAFVDGVWIRHLRARIEAAEGNPARLEAHARELLRLKPDDTPALLTLIEVYRVQSRPDLASALARYAMLAHPDNPDIARLHRRLVELRPPPEALPAHVVQIETIHVQALDSAGRGDLDAVRAAGDQLATLLSRFSASNEHLEALSGVYRELGEPALEAAVLIELIDRNPNRLEDLRRLARILKQAGAARVLPPVIAAAAGTAPGFDQAAGDALSLVGAHEEAVKYYTRWNAAAPGNGDAFAALGTALYNAGDVVRARAVLVKAASLTLNLKPVYMTLARIAAEERDPEDATVWLRRLLPLVTEDELSALLMEPAFSNIPSVLHQLR